jgi:hypothetical protein
VTVTVTDSTGGVGIVRFTLIVRDPIVISRIRSVRTWAGAPARLRIVAHDTRGGRIRYSAAGLPRGIAINPRTGLISGRIRGHARAYRVTITAHGAGGVRANARFRWTVR